MDFTSGYKSEKDKLTNYNAFLESQFSRMNGLKEDKINEFQLKLSNMAFKIQSTKDAIEGIEGDIIDKKELIKV